MKGFLKHRSQGAPRRPDEPAVQPATPYRFGPNGECDIWVAASAVQLARAWSLVYGVYMARGYAQPNPQKMCYGLHDALPETTTLLAERGGQAVAALTAVSDSPLALPADAAYGPELAALRRPGRRLCEIASLASVESEAHRGADTLNHLFKLAYLTARRLEGATNFVIRVSPAHQQFYERLLLFRLAGAERPDGGPGGSPGVLMELDLETAEARYQKKYGSGPRSFHRFVVDPATEPAVLEWLKAHRRGLTEITLRRFFFETQPLIPDAPEPARLCLAGRYPNYDLTPPGRKESPGT